MKKQEEHPKNSRRDLLKTALTAGGAAAAASLMGCSAKADENIGEVYNVRKFGAKGDGVTDDTAAAQSAIDAALKAGGGCIHFPSGRYRLTKSLVFGSSKRVDVTGVGSSTLLCFENDEPALLWKEGASYAMSSIRNMNIASVGKDKSPDTPAILMKGGAERSFFQHMIFEAMGAKIGGGIHVENVMDTTTIDHCLLWGPMTGTGFKVAKGSEVRIFGARIVGSADPYKGVGEKNIGIHLTGGNGGVHIVTTDIIGLHTGLRIGDPGGPSNREVFITHATFDSSVHGIVQNDNAYVSIAGCWAASSDEEQIYISEHSGGAIMSISGGTIFNGGAYGRPGAHNGIVVKSGSFMMTGVTVRNNKGTGVLIENARDFSITGCRIVENGTGVQLGGNNFTFTGNVLARNKTQIIDKAGSSRQMLANIGT